MAAVQKLKRCAVSQTGKHTASVIFLHGSGDTGQGLRAWVHDLLAQDLAFEHIRVIYPTAPARPYTPMHGALSHVWFDRYKISHDCPEHLESIEEMCSNLGAIVQDEIRAGIPEHRMVVAPPTYSDRVMGTCALSQMCTHVPKFVQMCEIKDRLMKGFQRNGGGFSMGGAMALHLACRYHQDVAGVFALSSFLNRNSIVYQAVEGAAGRALPELLQCHGTADELVPHTWGEETSSLLKKACVAASFHSFPGLNHQLCRPEMELLRSWIIKKLPAGGCLSGGP